MTTRILLIDEAQESLEAYKEAFAPRAPQWTLVCAKSANAGLREAQAQTPDIVIAALSTDDGHGAQILAKIEKIAPNAQLFITAAEAEKPKLESTFGSTFQFLPSPCPAHRLVTEIQRCVAIDTWLGNDRIKKLVAKMGEFPSLPPIYLKVVNALNSKEASAQTIAHAIAGDLAISAKVLQTVNSSYYGFDEKISNITQAVGVLGIDCVKNLVLAIQVFNKMGRSPEQRAITDQLWHHSMSVAVAARRIAEHETSSQTAAEEAYTAGLMHDIGKLVLLNAEPELYSASRQLARENAIPAWQAEDQMIGSNHAEVGAYLLARWGMPANLTEAVALHHQPVNSFGKSFSALAAVHVANAIAHERQSSEHPGAKPCDEFLVEIGKAESWETWLAVSSGKTPPQKTAAPKALSLKRESNATPAAEPAETPAQASHPDPEPLKTNSAPASQKTAETAQPSKSKTPLIAIAACLAVAAIGIYALTTKDSPDSQAASIQEAESKVKSTFAANLEQARKLSGLDATEDALQEIFDSQEAAAPPAKPVVEPAAKAEPKIAATAPAPEPAQLPKPKLPATDTFPNIELSGIFYNANKPLASVNGKIRRVGDSVNGATIVRIEKSQIVVQYQKTQRSYKLN